MTANDLIIWKVCKCSKCGSSHYFYGELSEYENTDFDCKCGGRIAEANQSEWNAKDYSEIFGNELEDQNRHGLTDMPNKLLGALRDANVEDCKQTEIMKTFFFKFFEQ